MALHTTSNRSLFSALSVFEVAARHNSFTRAGKELGVSQPTVSQHIALLEARLGVALFKRTHSRLELTAAGKSLSQAVELGFSHVDDALRKVQRHERRADFTISCSISFAYGWLLPRYSDLCQAAEVPVDVLPVPWMEDIPLDRSDIVINWRSRDQTNWPTRELFAELIYPVASPDLLSRLNLASNPNPEPHEISAAPLLSYEEKPNEFTDWERWFFQQGSECAPSEPQSVFSNYQVVVQAAMDGMGIALGWHHLVDQLVLSRRLRKCGPPLSTGDVCAAAQNPRSENASRSEAVIEWMLQEGATQPNDGAQ